MKRPTLSIVINTSGRLDCLPFSLGSVARETRGRTGVEMILVDNSPDGRVAAVYEEWLPRIPILRYEREPETGMVPARNAGLRAARNEVVAYIDDDAILRPGWMDGLLSTYERQWDGSTPIAVGGRVSLLYPEGVVRPDWLTPSLELWLTCLDFGVEDRVLNHPAESLVGANFSAPLDTFERIGGFPYLGVKYGADERSIEHLVLQAGGRIVYSGAAHVDHMVQANRLVPEWFLNRFRSEGLSRQRLLQALTGRSRPMLGLRACGFLMRRLQLQLQGLLMGSGSDSVRALEMRCQANYNRGSFESTWAMLRELERLKVAVPPVRRSFGNSRKS